MLYGQVQVALLNSALKVNRLPVFAACAQKQVFHSIQFDNRFMPGEFADFRGVLKQSGIKLHIDK